jgi:predicted ATP-grasp superfamily ATP-dependent carboligase
MPQQPHTYDGSYYEQKDGMAMGSSLMPVMEHLEETAMNTGINKPTHWYMHVDNAFVVWPHGKEALREFLTSLNDIHQNIKFAIDIEENGDVPFLDVQVTRILHDTLGHTS